MYGFTSWTLTLAVLLAQASLSLKALTLALSSAYLLCKTAVDSWRNCEDKLQLLTRIGLPEYFPGQTAIAWKNCSQEIISMKKNGYKGIRCLVRDLLYCNSQIFSSYKRDKSAEGVKWVMEITWSHKLKLNKKLQLWKGCFKCIV